MEVMMIQGKVENIFDNEDFARMLRERLGEDAERYFREQIDPDVVMEGISKLDDSEILNRGYCSGECDKVQGTQEHFERILDDIGILADAIYKAIMDGYILGSTRRTKKEQLALDKAIDIHRIVRNNR